jgi:hypothetical protein
MRNPGVVEYTHKSSYSGGRDCMILRLKPTKAHLGSPYLKNKTKQKRTKEPVE